MGSVKLMKAGNYLAVLTFAVVSGCDNAGNRPESYGCQAAYDAGYECARELVSDRQIIRNELSPVYECRKGKDCAEFVRELPDGYYWLVGTDEFGERFEKSVVVGENGWRYAGKVRTELVFMSQDYRWTNAECHLEDFSADSIRGICVNYGVRDSWCAEAKDSLICKDRECERDECTFAFPVGVSDSVGLSYSIQCLRSGFTYLWSDWAEIDAKKDSVIVSVTDSIISVIVPLATVTWTKRPGL